MKTRAEYIDDLVQYILDSEADDFAENPSDNHVYFSALVILNNLNEAQKELNETKKNLK